MSSTGDSARLVCAGFEHAQPGDAADLAIVTRSPDVRRIVELARRYAASSLPVLLIGPTGTGKELLAQLVHRASGRPGDLIDVNCGALPRELVESLLFGHRRGAFTGAGDGAPGLVARANRGTLFLDELTSLPLESQAKLLRVLETGEVRPVGETAKQRVHFRVIAAAHEELAPRVERGEFRADLYYRLAGIVLRLPPLCERPEDIEALAAHFAAAHSLRLGLGAVALLRTHPWPGNVRELRTVIDRAAVLCAGSTLEADDVAEALDGSRQRERPQRNAPAAEEQMAGPTGRLALLRLCQAHRGDADAIAEASGISRATLYRRLKACGLTLRAVSSSHLSHGTSETR